MKQSILISVVLLVFSISVMGWSWHSKEKASQPETMPLVPMMQKLLSDVQQVNRGIYTENFELIKEGAGNISDHPTMTVKDKRLVKQTLGKEMQQFVEFDMIVHHHADSMRIAAIEQNMQKVLKHYRITQQGCVDCHSNYREPISTARLEK